MALTIGAIYQPLDDFFTTLFATPDGSPFTFRFDQLGSSVSPADLRTNPTDPASPINPALVREKISDLVNRVPLEVDGAHVQFGSDPVDGIYADLLAQAQPYLPEGTTPAERQDLIAGVSRTITDAKKAYAASELTSVEGSPTGVHLTDTSPAGWWDPGKNDVWTHHAFTVTDTQPSNLDAPILWRDRPSPELLKELTVSIPTTQLIEVSASAHAPAGSTTLAALRRRDSGDDHVDDGPDDGQYAELRERLAALNAARRLELLRHLNDKVPKTPVTTSTVTITFDYCVVRLTRTWWTGWITGPTWKLPGRAQGSVNPPGSLGLRLLPLGFIAIRNLLIDAQWSDQDRATAKDAMSWGPFDVSASADTDTVSHPGLQVFAWLLQKLPDLPPNPPADGPAVDPPRTYTVAAGDTLSKIALAFYGDPSQYLKIAAANSLADPNSITVGQVLVIP